MSKDSKDDRQQRLAEALRANLRRRKAQARARADDAVSPCQEGPEEKAEGEGAETPSG